MVPPPELVQACSYRGKRNLGYLWGWPLLAFASLLALMLGAGQWFLTPDQFELVPFTVCGALFLSIMLAISVEICWSLGRIIGGYRCALNRSGKWWGKFVGFVVMHIGGRLIGALVLAGMVLAGVYYGGAYLFACKLGLLVIVSGYGLALLVALLRLDVRRRRSANEYIFEMHSQDDGNSWSQPKSIELPNPNSGIDALTLADGRVFLLYNHSKKYRYPLVVATSGDGQRWKQILCIEERPDNNGYSYPSVIQTSDGKIHIVYSWKCKKIRHVVLEMR